MTCIGKISNGVIVLPPEIHLPEGMELEVKIPESKSPSFAERFKDFIGMADDLPSDLSENLDHYLHGHPKK